MSEQRTCPLCGDTFTLSARLALLRPLTKWVTWCLPCLAGER
jgi:hypothetical protein